MEYLNFSDIQKSTFTILSIVSWLFFISTGIASMVFLSNSYKIIWTIERKGSYNSSEIDCYPLQMNLVLIYIVYSITIVFGILALLFLLNKTILYILLIE